MPGSVRSQIRVLCADDHVVVLRGLSAILSQESDIKVVACVNSADESVDYFRRYKPDVTLMDLQFPGMSGFDAIQAIMAVDRSARIVVLTMHHTSQDVRRALKAGASAYLLKDTLSDNLVSVIREVSAGGRPISQFCGVSGEDEIELSRRERDVLQLIAAGMRNKEIARTLGITDETVHAHLKAIYTKLKVHDRTLALAVAVRRGIVRLT